MHMAAGEAAICLLTVMNVNVDRGIITALAASSSSFWHFTAPMYCCAVQTVQRPLFQPPPGSRLLMSMEGFRFVETENGRVSWHMTAGSADLYENKEAQLKDIEITFVAPDRREARLLGEVADAGHGQRRCFHPARGPRGQDRDQRGLSSDDQFAVLACRPADCADNGPFKLLGSEIYLEGQGLSGNVDMLTIVVDQHVKAVLQE